MKNTDPDILVQRFVDGDLSDPEVREALHRIADDAEARDLLQFELEMTQDLAARPAAEPPPDFADRTMAVLSEAPATDSSLSRRAEWTAWWRSLTAPVAVEVRPLAAMAAAVLLAVGAWIVWPAASPGPSPTTEPASTTSASSPSVQQTSTPQSGATVWIRFLYTNSEADSVAVAGDFSQWDPIPLSPRTVNGETVWTGLVPVSRGEHEYQFVINGERWVTDPLAPVKRSDGFGAKNAVLEL